MMLAVGLIDQKIAWTADSAYALWTVVAVDVWKTTPFMALLILAGLQTLPKDCYEAARVDGVHPLRVFWKITLPLLWPALMVAVIFRLLDALRVFDLIYVLTSQQHQHDQHVGLRAAGDDRQRLHGLRLGGVDRAVPHHRLVHGGVHAPGPREVSRRIEMKTPMLASLAAPRGGAQYLRNGPGGTEMKRNPWFVTLLYVAAIVVSIVSVFPFIYAVSTSLKSGSELFDSSLWPKAPSLANYISLFTVAEQPFGRHHAELDHGVDHRGGAVDLSRRDGGVCTRPHPLQRQRAAADHDPGRVDVSRRWRCWPACSR